MLDCVDRAEAACQHAVHIAGQARQAFEDRVRQPGVKRILGTKTAMDGTGQGGGGYRSGGRPLAFDARRLESANSGCSNSSRNIAGVSFCVSMLASSLLAANFPPAMQCPHARQSRATELSWNQHGSLTRGVGMLLVAHSTRHHRCWPSSVIVRRGGGSPHAGDCERRATSDGPRVGVLLRCVLTAAHASFQRAVVR